MRLLDVNVLLYAHREDAPDHGRYRKRLEELVEGDEGCAVSDLVLSGFLRIATHPRVFDPPSPLDVAMNFVEELRAHEKVTVLAPGARHWELFLRLCREGSARGNLVADAYHAALAIESGCEWITTDRDFARFPGLRFLHPLQDDEAG